MPPAPPPPAGACAAGAPCPAGDGASPSFLQPPATPAARHSATIGREAEGGMANLPRREGGPAGRFPRTLLRRRSGSDPGVDLHVMDLHVLRFMDEERADHEGHDRDDDRIPETRVDVARL